MVLLGVPPVEAALARRILETLPVVGEVSLLDTADGLEADSAAVPRVEVDTVVILDAVPAECLRLESRLAATGSRARVLALPRPVSAEGLSVGLVTLLSRDPVGSTLAGLADQLGGAEPVRELVGLYLEALDARWSAIAAAWTSRDRDGVRRGAHTLASSSALLGAEALAALTRRLESAAPTEPDGEIDRLVDAGPDEVELARAALLGWLAGP